jgi:UDP-3-O-[3-hydroxymyristoyl] N-acetylglucosamine deacetylase
VRPQRTISKTKSVAGYGYWSGQDVVLEFHPAAPDTGLVFVRTDLPARTRIPALVGHRFEAPRRTCLACSGARVEMVEHVLAACSGLNLDNCEIHVNQVEMPGCDGSSAPFTNAILAAGLIEQSPLRRQLVVTKPTRVGDQNSWVEARPTRHPYFSVQYELDYGEMSPIVRQSMCLKVAPRSFERELAAARTFLLQEEADRLRECGIGSRVSSRDVLIFGEDGLVDNSLRFDDECARHKVLDLVGDFALAACDVVGQITAFRSGHRLNAEMVRALLTEGQVFAERRKSA